MTTLCDVCRNVRSKNAGPFWVTVDLFFRDADAFRQYARSPSLDAGSLATAFGADPALVRRFDVPSLNVVKFTYPRATPQGSAWERDMHSGQQYVRILNLPVEPDKG